MDESGGGLAGVRASDGEREQVAARLRAAAGEGRLTLDEFAERVERALAAVSRTELEVLTDDLPVQSEPVPAASTARRWIVAIMGGATQRGRWRIASRCIVVNVMGGADLDLTEATVEGPETEIVVISLMGGSKIVVPAGVHVDLGGFALMGGNDLRLDDTAAPSSGAPVIRVRAYSIMGGTDVGHRSGRHRSPRVAAPSRRQRRRSGPSSLVRSTRRSADGHREPPPESAR